jgi:hypothetical protein
LLQQEATLIAEEMRRGSANITDTAKLGRRVKRGERDARKLRQSDQYFGWVLAAMPTHRFAVYDRTSRVREARPDAEEILF